MGVASIALDPIYNDWQLVSGRLVTVTGAVECGQKIGARLRFFRRSWFRDTTQGVPWWETIFVKGADVPAITQMLRGVILATPGVARVETVIVDYQRAQRVLNVRFAAVHDSGAIIEGGQGRPLLVDGKPVLLDTASGGA